MTDIITIHDGAHRGEYAEPAFTRLHLTGKPTELHCPCWRHGKWTAA